MDNKNVNSKFCFKADDSLKKVLESWLLVTTITALLFIVEVVRFLRSDTHQYVCSSEEVAEGVVQQVDEGGCVQVGVTHHLRGEQGLSGATAEKATHHAVAHVHVMCHFLKRQEEEEERTPVVSLATERTIRKWVIVNGYTVGDTVSDIM